MRSRPMRYWFSISSPTERTRRLPRWSMSSISPLPSRRSTSVRITARMSSLRSTRMVSARIEVEPHVHLDAADRGEVVALGIEEQRVEHRLRGVERRRLARTHHAIDVEQRVLARHVLVDRQRVADVGADVDVVDVEDREFLVARLVEHFSDLLGDLLAGLGVDLAGLRVDEVLGDVVADQFLVGHAQRLQPLLGELAGLAHGDLLAGLDHDLAGVGVDQIVDRLVAACSRLASNGTRQPSFCALVGDLLVEGVEDRPRRPCRARTAATSPESSGGGRCAHGRCPWRRTRCRARSRDTE